MGAIEDLAAETERVIEETPGLEAAPPAEEAPAKREEREYVVLLRESPVEIVGVEAHWGELGRVSAFNRAGALEQVEARWPASLEGQPQLHLVPARFWQEITPAEQPPPPPKRKWKGL